MTYSPIQLEAIKIFGRKDLTEWCLVNHWFSYNPEIDWEKQIWKIKTYDWRRWAMLFDWFNVDDFEILWHEPHLEDVFRVAKEKWYFVKLQSDEIYFYTYQHDESFKFISSLPLLEQSEDTLTQLINLFK